MLPGIYIFGTQQVEDAEVPGEYDEEMSREVTLEEMREALKEMKNGRAPDGSDVKVELLKYAGEGFQEVIRTWINKVATL